MFGGKTCDILRSTGDVTGYNTPTVVHSGLRCTYVTEVRDEEREKGFMATVTRPCRCYVDKPKVGVIRERDVLSVNDSEYMVVLAKKWPSENPSYYELLMDQTR